MRVRLLPALLVAVALVACTPAELPQASPEEVGLTWRECPVQTFSCEAEEVCLGELPPRVGDDARLGARSPEGFELTIDADTYRTRHLELGVIDPYLLLRNGQPVSLLWGEFVVYDPEISLQRIAGKAAWEFSDPRQATVIYDGQDLRRVYGLDAVYRPHELAGKLAFIGRKAGEYFLVYDGRRVGPAFDEVHIAYCCEAVLYAPRGGEGGYRFWGRRGDDLYVVEVAADAGELAFYLIAEPRRPAELAGVDLGSLALQPEPILAPEDIVAYHWAEHTLQVTPEAAARLTALEVPTYGVPFAACVGAEPVYLDAFWTPFSSQSYDDVVIEMWPGGPREALPIELGYPWSPEPAPVPDPRSDGRVRQALEASGKLR